MAKDAGLRARQTKLSWQSLLQLGEAYPVLAELENGNWVVIASADGQRRAGDGQGSRPARRSGPKCCC